MSTYDDYPENAANTPADVEALKARWMIEGGKGVPFIALDLASPLADQLRLKQAEYLERIRKMRESGDVRYFADAKIKHGLLGLLLNNGKLDFIEAVPQLGLPATEREIWEDGALGWSLMQAIVEKNPEKQEADLVVNDYLDEMAGTAFNAFFVLQSYVNNGGEEIKKGSGTGLPSAL